MINKQKSRRLNFNRILRIFHGPCRKIKTLNKIISDVHDRKMKEKLIKLAKDLYHKQRRKHDKVGKGTKIHFVQKCVTEMLRNTHKRS